MKKYKLLIFIFLLVPALAISQEYLIGNKVKVAIVRNPNGASESILDQGLLETLEKAGGDILSNESFKLTDKESEYQGWARASLVNRHLGNLISENGKDEFFYVGLLQSCSDLNGMLAGLQNMGPGKDEPTYHLAGWGPLRVGLIYFDAHADINTPETTLSGMYGGMDVAHAMGLFNDKLRLVAGLDPPLAPEYVVLGDVRDTDPKEMDVIKRLHVSILNTNDIRNLTEKVKNEMDRLSEITDVIYLHIDMDVLEPEEVLGHGLKAPDGPSSQQLAKCIQFMAAYPKTSAIGIASTPYGPRDPENISVQAAIRLIEAAIKGVNERK